MSWSAVATGTPAAVRAAINQQLDQVAALYRDSADRTAQAEFADIEHARASINAALDQHTIDHRNLNGVSIDAFGSRSPGFASATFRVNIEQVGIFLDPQATPQ